MMRRSVRISCVLVVLTCILFLLLPHQASAQGSTGSSTGGSTSSGGAMGGQQSMSGGGSTFGGNIGYGPGQQYGGTSFMSQGYDRNGFGPLGISSPPSPQSGIVQENLYGIPGAAAGQTGGRPGPYSTIQYPEHDLWWRIRGVCTAGPGSGWQRPVGSVCASNGW
ncbi:hypothetical protein [Methanocella arvoryzae]|nr:hypothetical protein [Methanocella arvoryzae]